MAHLPLVLGNQAGVAFVDFQKLSNFSKTVFSGDLRIRASTRKRFSRNVVVHNFIA